MSHIHPYTQADLKYTITNPKCNFRYKNLLTKKKYIHKKAVKYLVVENINLIFKKMI